MIMNTTNQFQGLMDGQSAPMQELTLKGCKAAIERLHEDNLSRLLEDSIEIILDYKSILTLERSTYAKELKLNCKRYDQAQTLSQKSWLTIMMLLDLLQYQQDLLSTANESTAV